MFPPGHIHGLAYSQNVLDLNAIDIQPGSCRSINDDGDIRLTAPVTVTVPPADGTYHVWAIGRSDTGDASAILSTSATNPTMPTDFDLKRRRGAIVRRGGIVLPFSLSGNTTLLTNPPNGVSFYPSTSAVLATLEVVPNGVQVTALLEVFLRTTDHVRRSVLITSPDQVAATPAAGTMSTLSTGLDGVSGGTTSADKAVRTNTSRQIRYQFESSSAAIAFFVRAYGWIDEV